MFLFPPDQRAPQPREEVQRERLPSALLPPRQRERQKGKKTAVSSFTLRSVKSKSPWLSVPAGPQALDHGLGPAPHLHNRHVEHHRRVGHGGVERDPPQDRVWFQSDRPWLPGPQLPGQCVDRTVGPGCKRGQP